MLGQFLLLLCGEYHLALRVSRRFFFEKANDHFAHLGVGKKLFEIHILKN